MSTHYKEEFFSKLLVEGNDDRHVILAICQKFNLPETFSIVDCKGVVELLKNIPIRIKLRDQYVGILIDADTDLSARWQQLRDILIPLGYLMQNIPDESGSIFKSVSSNTVIGIWIMPNNQVNGMLEDFAHILIPADDVSLPYAEEALDNLERNSVTRFSNIHRSKALIHTWLAWQESPGTPMGQAITKSYLNHNHELCISFVDWLNRLFNPDIQI
ncbi:DUF3226 domain-containing protein [Dyadobacter sp. NIV53]|uniref:DUF3226 domain-containing protein n=1 Tax=Dyadobacter sp. NIV53 TaxID=2861765 RepID=UPI001C862CAA|nr:DUF3226 domain-containing protein [Dyadobacter sp. NIV53]